MQTFWRIPFLAAALLCGLLVSPHRAAAQNAAPAKSGDYFNFFELNVYGGWGNYAKQAGQPFSQLEQGGVMGARTTENFWNYFALEQDFGFFSYHRLTFRAPTTNGIPLPIFGTHVYQGSFNGVLHFTPRDSKFRPFVTVGAGEANYVPNDSARKSAERLPPLAGFTDFRSASGFELNYGGGLKYQMSPRFGVRVDARGYYGRTPQFGLRGDSFDGSATIPHGFRNFGVQLTGGFTMYFGHVGERPAPPEPPRPAAAAPTAHGLSSGSISASSTSVCPGDTVRLHSDAADPQGHRLTYQWAVNGNNQGGNSADYNFTPDAAGDYRVGIHVSDTADNAASAVDVSAISIHVGVYNKPTAGGLTADPSVLDLGQSSTLHVNATGSECGGTLTYSWAASEGTVSGTGAGAQYNSTGVSFSSDISRPQSKPVTVTATVTDAKGGAASASTNITVNLAAKITHFGDIVFPKGSARVNNCGKRVLIEQLYPMLNSNANYDIVLVGHIDTGEVPKTKSSKGRHLDRDRVLQTAAVLSGGGGTCTTLDVSRIKGVWVGATQETETLPTSCTVSTTAPKERKGAELDANEAKSRRVEIWLVPKGMSLPPAGRDAKELPETEMKKIGCPK